MKDTTYNAVVNSLSSKEKKEVVDKLIANFPKWPDSADYEYKRNELIRFLDHFSGISDDRIIPFIELKLDNQTRTGMHDMRSQVFLEKLVVLNPNRAKNRVINYLTSIVGDVRENAAKLLGEIDDKYKGKTVAEIIKMFNEDLKIKILTTLKDHLAAPWVRNWKPGEIREIIKQVENSN